MAVALTVLGARVRVLGGSHHPVDSAQSAYKVVGMQAFREAAEHAEPVLLEPIMAIEVVCSSEDVGDVIGDLSARRGKITGIEARTGVQVVAGLVAITPACGSLSPVGSILLGLAAGALCALAVGLKYRFGYDDSLDVVGVHLVGGLVGTIGVGFLATSGGLFYGDGIRQLVVQTLVAVAAMVWAGVLTLLVGLLVKAAVGWRIPEEDEVEGIDFTEHGETAYELTSRGGAGSRLAPTPASTPSNEGALA